MDDRAIGSLADNKLQCGAADGLGFGELGFAEFGSDDVAVKESDEGDQEEEPMEDEDDAGVVFEVADESESMWVDEIDECLEGK